MLIVPRTAVRLNKIKGVALVSVMIVVALVSATASWLIRSQHVSIERTTQIINQEQAMLNALSMEFFVLAMLDKEDSDKKVDYYTTRNPAGRRQFSDDGDSFYDRPTDQNRELWSREWDIKTSNFTEFENLRDFRNIKWSVCMYDLSGLIDVNLLHRGLVEPDSEKRLKFMKDTFLNLFAQSDLGPEDDFNTPTAEELRDILVDWFDSDDDPQPYGVESSEYLIKEPPYLPSGMRMIWPEEIYLVHKFSRRAASDFFKHLTALPYLVGEGEQLKHKININTAPYAVLRALPGLDKESDSDGERAGYIREHRKDYYEQPFKNVAELCKSPLFYALCDKESSAPHPFWSEGAYKKYLGVRSEFIQSVIKVQSGGSSAELQSLIARGKKSKVLQRRFGSGYYKQCQEAKRGNVKGRA